MERKKIIFILNNFAIGGTEKFLLDLATELSKGYNIEIISVLGQGPLADRFKKISTAVHFLGPLHFYNRQSLPQKVLWLLSTPVTLIRVMFFLHKVKPDIIITSLWHADILGGMGGYLTGIQKRILIHHDTEALKPFRAYLKKLALHMATDIIANSATTKVFLTNSILAVPQKIKVIPIGINAGDFLNLKTKPVSNFPVFGFMGRMEPIKGCECFMEGLRILKENKNLSPKVFIAGAGSLKNKLEKYKNHYGLEYVEFLGEITDIPSFLNKIDVLVVPSMEEGFGLVLLEGLIGGKIVIASDIPVFKEITRNTNVGIWFEVNNSSDLSICMEELLKKPEILKKHQEVATASRRLFATQYDIEEVAKDYINLFSTNYQK